MSLALIAEPALGQRADQKFKQFRIDPAGLVVHGRAYCRMVSDVAETAGKHDFGDGDQRFGAGLEIGGLEQRLFFGRADRATSSPAS